MIIGATPESDRHILTLTQALYDKYKLKRVFYSAYMPVSDSALLPAPQSFRPPLLREHRLYQADWLLRFYRFDVAEIIDEDNPFLDPDLDPKANWAINHLDFFPVEVNTAPLEALLRVPGIGVRGANLIVRARRTACLREPELRKLGIAYKPRPLLHHVQAAATQARASTSPARGCARSWPRPSRAATTAAAPTRPLRVR